MINIENIYTDYKDIVNEFTEDSIKGTLTTLMNEIETFAKSLGITDVVHVDDVILTHAVLDYYSDVSRLKRFHNIATVNKIKKIAYESYWFLRRKPIQVNNKANVQNDKLAFVNEKFVYSRIASFLISNSEVKEFHVEAKAVMFRKYLDSFYYYLKYRNYDPQIFELLIMSFEAGIVMGSQK
ncbi:MAG: hypothetical protein NC131_04845 [Roseburia sp.]|nr:hypothetical protein [Roseburia sp.]